MHIALKLRDSSAYLLLYSLCGCSRKINPFSLERVGWTPDSGHSRVRPDVHTRESGLRDHLYGLWRPSWSVGIASPSYESVYLSALRSATAFTILSSQYFTPYGYTEDVSGFIGATLLLSGILASAIISPIFDRVLTRHLGRTIKTFVPILSVSWLSLIWAGKFSRSTHFA